MNKKIVIGLIIFALILLSSCIIGAIIFFQQDDENTLQTPDGILLDNQEPIKGPNVGEGGNNFDNTFRSLTISPTDSDIVFIGNEGNGIFRTMDGGKNWGW